LGDRLSYHFDVDQRIDLKATQIPLFLLQPFLENAIWHGIHPKAEGGTVELRMQKWSNRVIRIEIQDDGVGRSADKKRTERDQDRRSWGKDISDQLLQRFNRSRLIPVELKDGINGTGTQVTIYLTERRYPSKGGAKTGQ
jgi:sensor histidine kinase YesM